MVNPYPYGTGYRGADRTVEGLSDRILKSMGLDPQRPDQRAMITTDSSLSVHQTVRGSEGHSCRNYQGKINC